MSKTTGFYCILGKVDILHICIFSLQGGRTSLKLLNVWGTGKNQSRSKVNTPGPFPLCHLVIQGDQAVKAGPSLTVHLFLNMSVYIQLPTTEFHEYLFCEIKQIPKEKKPTHT